VLAVGVFALSGWRPGRAWLLLGAAMALSAIADTVYLYEAAKDTYVVGGVLDSMWIASALAIGCADWRRLGVAASLPLSALARKFADVFAVRRLGRRVGPVGG
jgi:hypothetical protein